MMHSAHLLAMKCASVAVVPEVSSGSELPFILRALRRQLRAKSVAANLSLLDTTITQLFRVRSTSELLAGCQTNHVVILRLQVCLCVAYSKRYAIPGVEAKVGTICTKQLCAPFTNQQHPRAIPLPEPSPLPSPPPKPEPEPLPLSLFSFHY